MANGVMHPGLPCGFGGQDADPAHLGAVTAVEDYPPFYSAGAVLTTGSGSTR